MMPGSAVSVRYFEHALLGRDRRDAFRHADAEIDDAARRQLEGAAPRDDLALVERHRLDAIERHPLPAGKGVVIGRAVGLEVVLRPREHDAIDQHAGDLDLARIERIGGGDALDLRDDEARASSCAAIAAARLSSVSASRSIVMLPAGIGGGAADQRDVDREGFVAQPLLAIDLASARPGLRS